jgi:hypothetical protein
MHRSLVCRTRISFPANENPPFRLARNLSVHVCGGWYRTDANLNRLTHRVIRRQGGVPVAALVTSSLTAMPERYWRYTPCSSSLAGERDDIEFPGGEVIYQSVCAVACLGRVTVGAARHRVVYVHRHVIRVLVNLPAQRAKLRGSCGPC